jgi:hypothetical protein
MVLLVVKVEVKKEGTVEGEGHKERKKNQTFFFIFFHSHKPIFIFP